MHTKWRKYLLAEREHDHGVSGERDKDGYSKRREAIAYEYSRLPVYGSFAYWRAIEGGDVRFTLSNEVFVRCLREAIARGDVEGRNRILTRIIRRTQKDNEYWAIQVVNTLHVQSHERKEVVKDLYADLYEQLLRSLMDMSKTFWEENFQHCLRFERLHVLQVFLMREGWWKRQEQSDRVPRNLVERLDAAPLFSEEEQLDVTVEDELAAKALLAVELTDISLLLLRLPEKLRSVLFLLYWEEKTEKEVATLLEISDRTVRNRRRHAIHLLRSELWQERESVYG